MQFRALSDSLLGFLLFLELTFGFVKIHVGMVFKESFEVAGYRLTIGDADLIIWRTAR